MPPNSTDLDLFVLALVQRGCTTPYDFKSQAGISVGSSAPVLARLEKSGYVMGSDPGVRDRRQFSITKAGTKTLDSGWRRLLTSRPTDPDATLRITYMAWALGRPGELTDFIDSASTTLKNVAATRLAEATQLQPTADNLGGQAFRWLKASFEAARLAAQSQALKELGKQIKKQKKDK